MNRSNGIVPVLLFTLFIGAAAQPKPAATIPEIKKFTFKSIQSKTVPGLVADRELVEPVNEAEKIGNLVATKEADAMVRPDVAKSIGDTIGQKDDGGAK